MKEVCINQTLDGRMSPENQQAIGWQLRSRYLIRIRLRKLIGYCSSFLRRIYIHFFGAGEVFIYTSPAPEKYLYVFIYTLSQYCFAQNILTAYALKKRLHASKKPSSELELQSCPAPDRFAWSHLLDSMLCLVLKFCLDVHKVWLKSQKSTQINKISITSIQTCIANNIPSQLYGSIHHQKVKQHHFI